MSKTVEYVKISDTLTAVRPLGKKRELLAACEAAKGTPAYEAAQKALIEWTVAQHK